MKHSVEELIAIVYRYYPRGMWQSDEGYSDTEQTCRLRQARMRAGEGDERWRAMLRRLDDLVPEGETQNSSLHLRAGGNDACYVAWLWLPVRRPNERDHYLGILVSFLAPYYVVYSASRFSLDEPIGGLSTRQEIRFDISQDEQRCARAIVEEIEATFPGCEPMSREVGSVIVPDVVTGNRAMGEATLYDCLFTDYR